MSAAELDAVVVTHRSTATIGPALASLRGSALPLSRVVVVDSGSGDGTAGAARAAGAVDVVELGENAGFGAACNAGVRACSAPWVLVVNPDARLVDAPWAGLAADLASRPRVGVVGFDVRTGGVVRGVLGPLSAWRLVRYALGLDFPRLQRVARGFAPRLRPRPSPVVLPRAWVQGACLLVRRSAFDEVGGFAASYFMYWEDFDLCERMRSAGWQVCTCDAWTVVHDGGASTHTYSGATRWAWFSASAEAFVDAHVRGARRWWYRALLRVLGAARRAGRG